MAVAAGNEGVLILHGFTGSPWEVRPVAERLASTGRSIAMPVLAGHGTNVADLDQTTWHDWLASAIAARAWLDRRCDTIHVVGLSMGGLLAVLVANDFGAARLGSLTLLAPAFTLGTVPTAAIKTFHTIGWPKVLGKDAPVLARNERPPAYWQVPVSATNSYSTSSRWSADRAWRSRHLRSLCRELPMQRFRIELRGGSQNGWSRMLDLSKSHEQGTCCLASSRRRRCSKQSRYL